METENRESERERERECFCVYVDVWTVVCKWTVCNTVKISGK